MLQVIGCPVCGQKYNDLRDKDCTCTLEDYIAIKHKEREQQQRIQAAERKVIEAAVVFIDNTLPSTGHTLRLAVEELKAARGDKC